MNKSQLSLKKPRKIKRKEPLYFSFDYAKPLWLEWLNTHDFNVNGDGSVDINGDVALYAKPWLEIDVAFDELFPLSVLPFKFNHINGDFTADSNHLQTLINFPIRVEGNCHIPSVGPIRDLKGCPSYVGKDFRFYTDTGTVQNLIGGPTSVGGDVVLNGSSFTSLKGSPTEIFGDFNIPFSRELVSLEGAPKIIHGDFSVHGCINLPSLKNGPEIVKGYYRAAGTNLKSLEGAPREVEKEFLSDDFSDKQYREYIWHKKKFEGIIKRLPELDGMF